MELKTLVSNFSQYSELISLKLEQRLNIKNQNCKPEALAFNNLNTLRKWKKVMRKLRSTYLKYAGFNSPLAPEVKSWTLRSKLLHSGARALSFNISVKPRPNRGNFSNLIKYFSYCVAVFFLRSKCKNCP